MKKQFLILLPLVVSALAGCSKTKTYPCSDYLTSIEWKDVDNDFRVLQLCDIHFSQVDQYERHFGLMDLTIKDADPDLIVLNGDSFTYADKTTVSHLFNFIESYGIPWTFAFGNHDDQGYYPDNYIQRLLADNSTYKHVKFVNIENDDVSGRGNFAINIYQNKDYKNVKFQVYVLDSHSYNFDTFKYDYLKEDQINWYKRMVEYTNKDFMNNDSWEIGDPTVPSACYFHIPLQEFFEAWYAYKDGNPDANLVLENTSTDECSGGPLPESDTHFFDVCKEYGSTKAICVAHDHINDSVINYKGINLCFGVSSTDRIYYDENKLGGQVMVINKDDQSLSFENIYHTYSEVENK